MSDERLRAIERRWRETGALDDLAALEAELYRAGIPFAEALLRTRGGLIAVVNSADCAFPKYAAEKDKLTERFLRRARDARTRQFVMHDSAIGIAYARLGRPDDVVNILDDINDDDALAHCGRMAIREFARNDDFKSIISMLDVVGTPDEFCSEAASQYLARGREKEAIALAEREEIELTAGETNHALARFHAAQGRYDAAASLLEQDEFAPHLRAEFVARAAAKRKDYSSARKLSEEYPEAIETAARHAARNRDYDFAFEIAQTSKHRSAAAHMAILEESAMKRDYTVAQKAMRGAFVLSGQANYLYWKTAIRNGDFDIAAPYAPRNKKHIDKDSLAIGNLRIGNLPEAQKFARTSSQPSEAYCNLALALSGKEVLRGGISDE